MNHINIMIEEKMLEFSQLFSSSSCNEDLFSRTRRARVISTRQAYDSESTQSENDLTNVEAAVDELRRDVVERR